jgi:RNA polymerase sigma factor FliA
MLEEWRETLVHEHIGLVKKISSDIFKKIDNKVEFDELVSYGTIGLYDAVKKYDPKRGIKFSTFSYYRIRGSIYDGLKNYQGKLYNLNKLHIREATNEYLAQNSENNNKVSNRETAFKSLAQTLSGLSTIYMVSTNEENFKELPDKIQVDNEEIYEKKQNISKMNHLLSELDEKELKIIKDYYYKGKTFEKIGEESNHSKSWASRYHTKIINKLKNKFIENFDNKV